MQNRPTTCQKCGNDQKKLFAILSEIMCKSEGKSLPEHDSEIELAETFNNFFIDKITKIRNELDSKSESRQFREKTCESRITQFEPCTESELESIIKASSSSSCELDPIPTPLLKECLPSLLPYLTYMVNLSISSGQFPTSLKTAIVRPLIKKANLDKNELKNYRPVSNIPFISKIIEKTVVKRLEKYMSSNSLHEKFQSAYRKNHGTETALLKIQNDILRALDSRRGVILVMLDLSAAFDTIDHDILIERLRTRIGVGGSALRWFTEYHKGRTQATLVNHAKSQPLSLHFGAPQGSIMGPEDYKIYTLPVGDIARNHELSFHGYADDSGNYVSFDLNDESDFKAALDTIKCATSDIKAWMTDNKLKLNDSKTEVLVIVPHNHAVSHTNIDIDIADATVQSTSTAKSLGVVLDDTMSMVPEIEKRCKTLLFYLRRIRIIRRHLSRSACEKLVLISSRLD